MVLGELQGGSRFMTKRPQAATLRFIWEALRKSRPGAKGVSVLGHPTPYRSPRAQPSPVHTSAFRENAFLPLQPGPPLNDRVTEGHLKGQRIGLKNSALLPLLPQAPPWPPGSWPELPVSMMPEPEGPREMKSMSSLEPVGKLRPREARCLSRATHEAGQSGQGHRPLDSHEVPRESFILGELLPLGFNFHSSARVRSVSKALLALMAPGAHEVRGQRPVGTSAKSSPCGTRLRESW